MPDEPNYVEAVRVGWLLLWRGVGSFFALLVLINVALLIAMPDIMRTDPPMWAGILPFLLAGLGSLFGIMPGVVRALFRKRFPTFEVRLHRRSTP